MATFHEVVEYAIDLPEKHYYIGVHVDEGRFNNSVYQDITGVWHSTTNLKRGYLGIGSELQGQEIIVDTLIKDIPQNTKHASIKYSINGRTLVAYNNKIKSDHGSNSFITVITFS